MIFERFWRTVPGSSGGEAAGRGRGGVVADAAAPGRTDPGLLADALDALPDGVAVFDANWTIRYVNASGARILRHDRAELVGRTIWVALPELGGTILHSFLLHARGAGRRVTWQGYYAPRGRWLDATAVRQGESLHVTFREVGDEAADPAVRPADEGGTPGGDDDRDRLRFLAEVSETMISTLDTGESLSMLVDLVVPRMCDWAVVSLIGEHRQPVDSARGHRDPARIADIDAYLARPGRPSHESSPMATAFFTGEPIHLDAIPAELVAPSLTTDAARAAWERLDPASFTIVPLRARGEVFGGLAMMNTSARPPHTEMEIATAVEVARRAGLALDNARLYGQLLQVAETLQRSLLSPPPQPDQLELAVRYQPAASNMHVGGDWYDAFQQPDGATLLVIGDVVGHNVDAAAAMGQIRSIVRGIAYDRQEDPARVLTRVDGAVTGLRIGTLATALIARIEQTAGQVEEGVRLLRWSSAGHLPPLVHHDDGTVELLATVPEPLLGAESPHPRTNHTARLRAGDTLVFYTDGLVEQGRTGIDAGLTRLAALVGELGHLTPDQLCDQLLARIVADRSEDDVAIVVVRCQPQDRAGPLPASVLGVAVR
jgi:serine phosphatase RsbU (regulator of sigma subunit)